MDVRVRSDMLADISIVCIGPDIAFMQAYSHPPKLHFEMVAIFEPCGIGNRPTPLGQGGIAASMYDAKVHQP